MLYMHYAKTRPEQPEPATGRIYAYGQAGKDFYLNAGWLRRGEQQRPCGSGDIWCAQQELNLQPSDP
jgi:hypothetical protein